MKLIIQPTERAVTYKMTIAYPFPLFE